MGTFVLVFTVGASTVERSPLTPVAAGAALMVMVYAGGHISGGHYNPAVTLAVWARRRIGLRDAAVYWVVQIGAGLVAGGAVSLLTGLDHLPSPGRIALAGDHLVAAFVSELVFTFALCFVVLNTATSKDHRGNSFYGLAIGLTVTAGAVAVGAVSGAAFNPAVSIGNAVVGVLAWPTLWVYVVAQLAAGGAAALAFMMLNPGDR
ncbi:porin [Mycolicibacterium canariasense]|nr:porin [Mycolicibacterium canariasense]